MTILLNNNGYDNDSWEVALEKLWPEKRVCRFGTDFDPADITYALVWNHPPHDLRRYPNLQAIFSLGAGAEHLMADDTLPDVPVVLLADPAVAQDMAAHALFWVMNFHRKYADYATQQANHHWNRFDITPTCDLRVGVLGLGRIGTEVATRIQSFGYAVSGWDAFDKQIEGIETAFGTDALNTFLGEQDIVINCLPLTEGTRHLLGTQAFAAMQSGAFFINISRGAVVDHTALLAALDADHLAGAALDAFAIEPLPSDDPIWTHPKVRVTPHVAGATFASSAAKVIIGNIRTLEQGGTPQPLFNRANGY